MFLRLLTFLCCCFAFPYLFAQSRCRVFGTIHDEQGGVVEFAMVRMQGTTIATNSNLKGEYNISIPSQDSVVLVYSLIGYETRKRVLRLPKDSLRIDIVLPTYGARIGETVVSGKNVQTGTTQRLQMGNSKFAPSATGNAVEELVATQAGVSTHNELSSQYNVRGGSFDENVVYLNGIEIYRPMLVRSGQQEGLSVINSHMVDKVTFSSGGFEAKYGDKMSSVLDISYKRPEKFEASVTGSMLGGGVYLGWGNPKFSLMSSVRYKSTKYLLGTMDTKGEYHPNFLDYQLMMSWHPSQRWSFDVIGNISDNHYDFAPQDRETKFGTMFDSKSFKVYFDGEERDKFRTLFGAATLTRNFSPETFLALQLSTFETQEQETYDIQGQYWLQEATTQEQLGVGTYMEHARNYLRAKVFKAGLRFRSKFSGHILQAGFDWRKEAISENSREWEMRDSMGYSLPHSIERLQLIYALRSQNDINTTRWESFLEDTWRHNSSLGLLNLTYGLRFTQWSWNSESLLSPRFSAGFLPAANNQLTIRFATGFYYQTPFYKELRDTSLVQGIATVELNRNIKSQRSIHFVLGGDYTFRMGGRPFKFTTEIYYKALSQLIPYSINNLRVVYESNRSSRGYAAGIDFKLFGEFVPGTDSWLTFSVMKTEEKLDGVWLPRPTDQRYNLSFYFTDYFPGSQRWAVTLRAALAAGLPFGPSHAQRSEQTFRAPAYKRVDVGVNYHLYKMEEKAGKRPISGWGRYLRNVWIGLDCFNLLGINNVNSYYWITDITNTRYAVPNFLTGRQLNLRFVLDF